MARNIAKNFNRLSRVHERYRQTDDRQTGGPSMTYSEHGLEFTFAKNETTSMSVRKSWIRVCVCLSPASKLYVTLM